MKNWFKKIGQKLYGKTPADQPLKSKEKKALLKKKSSTTTETKDEPTPVADTLATTEIKDEPTPVADTLATTETKDEPTPVKEKSKVSWFNKLGENFKRTSSGIKKAIFSKNINNDDLDYLEEAFLMSDLGVTFTEQLLSELKRKKIDTGNLRNEVIKFLESQFNENKHEFIFRSISKPQIILMFGVNGSGKTTTLAKLAGKAKEKGLSPSIVAADTFRAAAVEQLLEWGSRLNLDVFTGYQNEDPSSVVFKAHKQAIEKKTDVLLIDTAGRLHNKTELMEELKKIVRTIQKNDPEAPHHKLLVLDSTIGQNTYSQLEAFHSSIGITGVIMTKLDSSSKGGSLIGISKKYKTPIHYIGVGEKIDDLIDFNAKDFINALIGNDFGEKDESLH
ncbi:MAG: signal recognition particle-docking protein FtsY [Pseudomonadota bacterium]|nr:signal recognition particle-docking protein FtsY [Pseudomonadota bacterium]